MVGEKPARGVRHFKRAGLISYTHIMFSFQDYLITYRAHWLLTLMFLLFPASTWSEALDQAATEETGDCPSERFDSILDRSYCWLSTGVSKPAEIVDKAFSTKDQKNDKPGRIRVKVSTGPKWDSKKDWRYLTNVSTQATLPNLQDRLSIEFNTSRSFDPDAENSSDSEQEEITETDSSFGLVFKSIIGRAGSGIRWNGRLIFYSFLEIPFYWKLFNHDLALVHRFTWDDDDSFGWSNSFLVEHPLKDPLVLGFSNQLNQEYDPDVAANISSLYLRWHHNKWQSRSYLGYEQASEQDFESWNSESYWVGVSTSKAFFRPWIRFGLTPQISWPEEYDFNEVRSIAFRATFVFDSKYNR